MTKIKVHYIETYNDYYVVDELYKIPRYYNGDIYNQRNSWSSVRLEYSSGSQWIFNIQDKLMKGIL